MVFVCCESFKHRMVALPFQWLPTGGAAIRGAAIRGAAIRGAAIRRAAIRGAPPLQPALRIRLMLTAVAVADAPAATPSARRMASASSRALMVWRV